MDERRRFCRGTAGRIAPNLLEQNFEDAKPNQKWGTDVTEFGLFGRSPTCLRSLDCNAEILSVR